MSDPYLTAGTRAEGWVFVEEPLTLTMGEVPERTRKPCVMVPCPPLNDAPEEEWVEYRQQLDAAYEMEFGY